MKTLAEINDEVVRWNGDNDNKTAMRINAMLYRAMIHPEFICRLGSRGILGVPCLQRAIHYRDLWRRESESK